MTKERYQSLPVKTLRELAKARGIRGMSTQKKAVIIDAMLELDAREAEAAASSEAREVSPAIYDGAPVTNDSDADNTEGSAEAESVQTPPQRRAPKSEETEQSASPDTAKTESASGDEKREEKREEKRDKSVYVPGAIPGDQGNTVRGLLDIMTY